MIAWLFGGQGHERPGEGRALLPRVGPHLRPEHRRAIERGGRSWSRTEALQPLLVDLALACLAEAEGRPDLVLGHSLGELAAACAAGAFRPEATLELARVRGRAMARVSGGMCAVAIGERHPGLRLAVENPGHDVLAGPRSALRGRRLPVAGAWHTPAGRSEAFEAALQATELGALRCPVLLGDGRLCEDDPRPHLGRQVGEVLPFRRALDRLVELGVVEVVVFPPGRLLARWAADRGLRVQHALSSETP